METACLEYRLTEAERAAFERGGYLVVEGSLAPTLVQELVAVVDPIRRRFLGASPTGGYGYTSPTDPDVPLRGWLREHRGEAAP